MSLCGVDMQDVVVRETGGVKKTPKRDSSSVPPLSWTVSPSLRTSSKLRDKRFLTVRDGALKESVVVVLDTPERKAEGGWTGALREGPAPDVGVGVVGEAGASFVGIAHVATLALAIFDLL
jgi:hypothetical protein